MSVEAKQNLVILFGRSGVGKNTAGEILRDEFAFLYHDADDDFTPEMRTALRETRPFTEEMRGIWIPMVISSLRTALEKSNRVALSSVLPRNKYREEFLSQFPFAKFVLLKADRAVAEERLQNRYKSDPKWADVPNVVEVAGLNQSFFEEPSMQTVEIWNNENDKDSLRAKLDTALKKLGII